MQRAAVLRVELLVSISQLCTSFYIIALISRWLATKFCTCTCTSKPFTLGLCGKNLQKYIGSDSGKLGRSLIPSKGTAYELRL